MSKYWTPDEAYKWQAERAMDFPFEDSQSRAYVHGYSCGRQDPPRNLEEIWVEDLRESWRLGFADAIGDRVPQCLMMPQVSFKTLDLRDLATEKRFLESLREWGSSLHIECGCDILHL